MDLNFRCFLKVKLKLIYICLIFLSQNNPLNLQASDKNSFEQSETWILDNNNINEKKTNNIWELNNEENPQNVLDNLINYDLINSNISTKNFYHVRALGNAISINGYPYPEISNYVPNAIVEDPYKFITSSLRIISKTRHCKGDSSTCADAILNLDYAPFVTEKYSFGIKSSMQSLSSRGTEFGKGITLGFKSAWELSSDFYMALGGEHLLHFDDTIDLGRNLFLVFTKYQILNNKENPSMLIFNGGIGSDFYGYKGNGFLGKTYCLGENTLTGDGSNNCQWGPIGSISYILNDRLAINSEWFGYGYGTGLSFKPFSNQALTFSLYATDYISNFPGYINTGYGKCNPNCTTRYYGGVTLSF